MKPLISLFLVLLFIGCHEEETYPDVPIDKQEVIDILVDLSLAQGAVSNFKSREKDSVKAVYRYQIQEIYGYPMKTIDSTLNVIYSNPKLNREIQQVVLDSLKIMEEKVGTLKNKKGSSNE